MASRTRASVDCTTRFSIIGLGLHYFIVRMIAMASYSQDDLLARAVASLNTGRMDQAELALKELLRNQPRHAAALNILGIVLAQRRRYDEAEYYLRLAMDENSTSETTLYNYGVVLKALRRPTEALQCFTQALAINSAVAETWNNRGTVFNDMRRY